jgi:hypothetical protein
MALTIQDQPTTNIPEPSFAPIEYLVSSTETAQSGFKVIASLFTDPSGDNTKIATLQLNTIPSATQVVTDIQNIIQSFITSDYSVLAGDTTDISQSALKDFKIAFQEYYSGALQGSEVSGNTFDSWNSSPKYIEWADLSGATKDYYDWSIEDASAETDKEFLNGFEQDAEWFNLGKSNNFLKVRSTQKYQASWIMRQNLSDTYKIYLKTLDSTFTTILSTTMTAANTAGLYTLDVGASEIASHSWGTTPVMTNVKYYALRILNFTEDVWATKTIMFEIDDCDNTYTDYELHWLNRKGGYDSFTFNGKSNQNTKIKKNFAKYNTRTIGASSITHNTYAQRKRAFHTSLTDNYKLNSRLLKDFEVEGLEDLFSSPEVYWKNDTNFVSVNVTGNTFEHAKSENGEVYSMEVNMEIDNSDKRQW